MTVYISTATGNRDTDDISRQIQKYVTSEQAEIQTTQRWGKVAFHEVVDKAAEEKYKQTFEVLKEYILHRLAASMTNALMTTILNDALINFTESPDANNPFNREIKSIHAPQSRGGLYGAFVEQAMFGLSADTKRTEDLDDELHSPSPSPTEIKNTFSGDVDVGLITLSVKEGTKEAASALLDTKENRETAAVFKMMEKMKSLLLFQTGEKYDPNERTSTISIKSIDLFYRLVLRRVKKLVHEMIFDNQVGIISIISEGKTEQDKFDPTIFKKSFKVMLSLSKLDNVLRLTELYLMHENLLKTIEGDDTSRKNFFGVINDIKLKLLSGEIANKWDFDIKR